MSVPAERRRHRRHATKLPGSLDAGGGLHAACVLHDYCSGGVLVQQMHPGSGAPLTLAAGQAVQLKTVLRTPDGSRRVHLDATVAWANGDFLGLAFAEVDDAVVQAFGQHDRVHRAAGQTKAAARPGDLARYLARLQQVATGRLPTILRDILTSESIRNAMVVHAACGGSTNLLLHIPAVAHEAMSRCRSGGTSGRSLSSVSWIRS